MKTGLDIHIQLKSLPVDCSQMNNWSTLHSCLDLVAYHLCEQGNNAGHQLKAIKVKFLRSFMFLFCPVFAMSLCASVYMCFVVTCWERADLLALICGVYCEFVTFPLVSRVGWSTWLYQFLIIAPLLTLRPVPCPFTISWNKHTQLHSETYNWASAWYFQHFDILTSVDSDEPLQPPFKLRNSKWCVQSVA